MLHWPFVDFAFVHINKTGGSSIEKALGIPFRHRTALELIAEMGLESWRRCFTFTVVRNPWDKVVSLYTYRVRTNQTGLGDGHLEFKDWVREVYGRRNPTYHDKPKMFMPHLDWISDAGGTILVDYVARFENLEGEFKTICKRLRREATRLPHLKRSGHGDYRSYYDDESAELVRRFYLKDIGTFGYGFD